jgi:hypothetical protein
MTDRPKSPEAIRKAEERERRRAAGEYHLQRWIPGATRAEIEAAIERILQRHATTVESRDP